MEEGVLTSSGNTRSRVYHLKATELWHKSYQRLGLDEHDVWFNDVKPKLGNQPENVSDIWDFAFTEMLNNAIDHSGGTRIVISVKTTAVTAQMTIVDDGVGIFRKIQQALHLPDESHSVLELAKGKFTTDPRNHSGQGIFFTSRLIDFFFIMSGGVIFSHSFGTEDDWIGERKEEKDGTTVIMELNNHTSRTTKKVFDSFSDEEDYAFTKTVVPVKLAQYGSEKLVSRSQAKRLLARVEVFKIVIFDFEGVDMIGQSFADQIFRVFAATHPQIELVQINANHEVSQMISRAKNTNISDISGIEGEISSNDF